MTVLLSKVNGAQEIIIYIISSTPPLSVITYPFFSTTNPNNIIITHNKDDLTKFILLQIFLKNDVVLI